MIQKDFERIKKTITLEIRKDGNYPKYLQRQITTGLQQTADLIRKIAKEHEKFERQLLQDTEAYDIPLITTNNNKTGEYVPTAIDRSKLANSTQLEKDYPEAYAWEQVKGYGKSIKGDETFYRSISKKFSNIKELKNMDEKEKARYGKDCERILDRYAIESIYKRQLLKYNNKYNTTNPHEYRKSIKETGKHYKKVYNNIRKLDKKYGLGIDWAHIQRP